MSGFEVKRDQIVAVAASLTADQLARKFNLYTDSLSQAAWSAETKIGETGLGLDLTRMQACIERLFAFFGQDHVDYAVEADDCFGDWADRIGPAIHQSLRQFSFLPAVDVTQSAFIHPADELWQDARSVANLVQGRRRVISMVAPHSLFGFVTAILAPNLLRVPVTDGRPLSPEKLEQTVAQGDLIIATPTQWRFLLQSLPTIPNNIVGLSFGEPLPLDLFTTLRERGLAAMREFYGSTETGIIGWRDSPMEGFVPFEHWARNVDDLKRLRPDGDTFSVSPMDVLEWKGSRSFTLQGRRDGAVQIGAVNVFPKTIAAMIAQHHDVENCVVTVSKRGASLDRLIAHIKLRDGVRPDEVMAWKVDAWCRKNLRPPERPRIYSFVEELPS